MQVQYPATRKPADVPTIGKAIAAMAPPTVGFPAQATSPL